MISSNVGCTGCSACYSACPQNAISIIPDEEGFLVPKIDVEKCSNCGKCDMVCPLNHKNPERKPIAVYAAKHSNEETRLFSSSGGMFSAFAEKIIAENGVVFGAKFNENMEIVHCFTETIEGLADFRGSKYVQSNIGDSYIDAKRFLDSGRQVLFTGTPCQIAGLKSFLQKDYENLLTVDLICYGVPSPLIWKKYLESILAKYKDSVPDLKITKAFFRDKIGGWGKYNFSLFAFSKELNQEFEIVSEFTKSNKFLQCFLSRSAHRRSCYDCPFKSLKSSSDITIGDFWGIKNIIPDFYDRNGVSLVLLNSGKGVNVFNNIQSVISQKTDYNQILEFNQMLEKSAEESEERKNFYKNIVKNFQSNKHSVNYASPQIGVLAPFWQDNYGTILQEFALIEALKLIGYQPTLICPKFHYTKTKIKIKILVRALLRQIAKRSLFLGDSLAYLSIKKACLVSKLHYINYKLHCMNYKSVCKQFNLFIKNNIPCKIEISINSLASKITSKDFDTIIIGSDQVWSPKASLDNIYNYFGEFLGESSIKIMAYAPSFGTLNWEYTKEQTAKCKDLLKRFIAISVRESDGVDKCQKYFNQQATHVLDPTMLLAKNFYEEKFVETSSDSSVNGFVLNYILDEDEERLKIINKISNDLNAEAKIINYSESIKKGLSLPSIDTWLSNFSQSNFVFTDSFHGTIFSIIFNKPFITLLNKKRGDARFLSLLETFNLKDRLITSASELTEEKILAPINWKKVNTILELEREKSLNFLTNTLAEIEPINHVKRPRYSLTRFIGKVWKKIGGKNNA